MHLLQRVDSVTDGNWGALNATGIYEEQRLGEEMTRIAPDLLAKGEATAVSSYVPRVVMTMYEPVSSACSPLYPYLRQYFRGKAVRLITALFHH